MNSLWLLLLPVAATFGWVTSSHKKSRLKTAPAGLPRNYLKGLNFLLNEEPDKAVDLFVKMIEVDSETIETHLALGNLFRRRGEVDRAIRIHQNLIARPQLKQEYRSQALYALAKDYLSAGVLDRAERLFLEIADIDAKSKSSYRGLLYIYEQEKEWDKAINIAQKLAATSEHNMQVNIAQYYCELADQALKHDALDQAGKYLKRALAVNSDCVRASLLMGQVSLLQTNYRSALRYLKRIQTQNPDWLYIAVPKIQDAYMALRKPESLITYLQAILREYPRMPIVVLLSEQIRHYHGDQAALHFVEEHVKAHPSVAGLHDLLGLQLLMKNNQGSENLEGLHDLTNQLLNEERGYQCVNCGFAGVNLHWHCPSCKQWETIKPAYLIEDV